MSGKIILLEGADCSGKTTIAQMLAEELGGVYYHNPAGDTELTNNLYNHVLKKSSNLPIGATRLLQLAANALNAARMNELKEQGKIVISDRNILSTVVYQSMDYLDIQEILGMVGAENYTFDHAFLLTNSYETMVSRMNMRGEPDEWDMFLMESGEKLINRYRTYAGIVYPNIKTITTDTLGINEVFEQIMHSIH